MMNGHDKKLKVCLNKAMEAEEIQMKEELKLLKPHIFSEKYIQAIREAIDRNFPKE